MEKLLKYILKGIIPDGKFEIESSQDQEGRDQYILKVQPDNIGLVIGKKGRIINSIRSVSKVWATLNDKRVNVSVETPE